MAICSTGCILHWWSETHNFSALVSNYYGNGCMSSVLVALPCLGRPKKQLSLSNDSKSRCNTSFHISSPWNLTLIGETLHYHCKSSQQSSGMLHSSSVPPSPQPGQRDLWFLDLPSFSLSEYQLYFLKIILIFTQGLFKNLFERERKGDTERETVLSPDQELNLQCKYMHRPGLKPATFWYTEQHSNKLSHSAKAQLYFF